MWIDVASSVCSTTSSCYSITVIATNGSGRSRGGCIKESYYSSSAATVEVRARAATEIHFHFVTFPFFPFGM